LLETRLVEAAVGAIRKRTARGTVHLETNGSLPLALRRSTESDRPGLAVFLDRARLIVKGGDGGRGVISFRREAHVPRGGPDGGDGGKGGDVVLRVDPQLGTLDDFRFTREASAEAGQHGAGLNSTGRSGADRVLTVPPGTLVIDRATGQTGA